MASDSSYPGPRPRGGSLWEMIDLVRRGSLILLLVVTAALLSAGCAPAAAPGDEETDGEQVAPTATPSSGADSEPPGGCWDGALPEHGVHCHVLEHAAMVEAIEVVAIYEAPNDVLHVFLARSAPLDDELTSLFRRKASAFLAERGESLLALEFHWTSVRGGELRGLLVPPSMEGYDQAFLHVGGLKAVASQPGWASWTQLWPDTSTALKHDPGSGARFDVSDIDRGNIPEPDCEVEVSGSGCRHWKLHPDSGIAGGHKNPDKRPGENKKRSYIQIKESLLPTDEEGRQALMRKLGLDRSQISIEFEFVPVKYDYGELWRWATILRRFALSPSNTIGIVYAGVRANKKYDHLENLFPLDDLDVAVYGDASTLRDTVGIHALDARVVVEALPELLPLLGIPIDAVGVVSTIDEGWTGLTVPE